MSTRASIAGDTAAPDFAIPYTVPADTPKELVKVIEPIYRAFQNIIQTLISSGGIAARNASALQSSANDTTAYLANITHRYYTVATESILQGAPISLSNSGGNLVVINASAADNTRPCHGYCSQSGGISLGNVGEVTLGDGIVSNLNGLVPGDIYYLGVSLGSYTATPPSGGSTVVQSVGFALTTNALLFRAFAGLS